MRTRKKFFVSFKTKLSQKRKNTFYRKNVHQNFLEFLEKISKIVKPVKVKFLVKAGFNTQEILLEM